jgi:hypothetical protein
MSPLWQRLLRWMREPGIRLPAPGLAPEALHPGDRLQIGSRLWRVETRRAAPAATFELTTAEGPPDRARLRGHQGRWTLTSGAGARSPATELEPAAVIHFPVGLTRR